MQRVPKAGLAAGFVLLVAGTGGAQQVVPAPGRPVPFDLSSEVDLVSWDAHAWTMDEGLPQNSVTSLAQTPDGYLWIGTLGGLVRFDGARFTIFDLTTTPELPSNRIHALCVDREGRMWIAAGGLAVLEAGVFRRVESELDPVRNVMGLAEDARGDIWIGGRGIARYTGGRLESLDGPPGRRVQALHSLEGEVWAAFFEVPELISLDEPREDSLPADLIARALSSRPSTETWRGGEALAGLPPAKILLQDRRGNVWASAGGRLSLAEADTDPESSAWSHRRVLETKAPILCLFEDLGGNVWIGTSGEGLVRLRRQPFARVEAAQGLPVRPTYVLGARGQGGWWLATSAGSGSVWSFDAARFERVFGTRPAGSRGPKSITCLLEDRAGVLWVVNGHRLWWLRDGQPDSVDLGRGLLSLTEARDGSLWGGAYDVIFRIEGEEVQELELRELALGSIRVVSEAPDGTLWFGGANGVGRLRNGSPEGFSGREGVPVGPVRAIHHDARGGIWFGSYGGGLTRFKDGVFTRCTASDGLPDNSICNIQPDQNGGLWVNSNRGVFRLEESELIAFAEGETPRIRARLLGTPEGDGKSGATAVDGRIAFPTISGLVVLDPARIEAEPRPLPVVIERLATPAAEYDPSTPEPLPPLPLGERDLVIDFTSPRLADFADVRYRYRLVGYDEDWIGGDAGGRASYRRLPPGRYRFEVVAVNSSGLESATPTGLDLVLPAYFHETAWFLAACVLALLALAFGGYRLRLRSVEAQRRQLQSVLSALEANIAVIDEKGWILSVNQAWRRFASENGGAGEWDEGRTNYLDACRRAGADEVVKGIEDVLSGKRPRFELEYACPSPHGPRWFVMYVTPLARGGAVVAHLDVTAVKRAEVELRSLGSRLNQAEEQERRRIARELHDDYSQRLAAVAIDIAVAAKHGGGGEGLQDLNARIRSLAEDIHDLSRRLHPSLLEDLGLARAVESECHDFAQRTGIDVETDVERCRQEPDEDTSISCYRILQECLRNVEKHARATWVRVELAQDEDHLTLSVRDNGRGFDVADEADQAESFGLGLHSMHERVSTLGGRLVVSSRAGEGTRIEARLPPAKDGGEQAGFERPVRRGSVEWGPPS